MKCLRQNDACGFSTNARKFLKFFKRIRHFSMKFFEKRFRHVDKIFRFRPKKSGWPDQQFHFFPTEFEDFFGCVGDFKKFFRNDIHAFIRTLGRQNGGNERFKRRREAERRLWVRVEIVEKVDDFFVTGIQNNEFPGWCQGAGSNCRHHGFQPCALPLSYPGMKRTM